MCPVSIWYFQGKLMIKQALDPSHSDMHQRDRLLYVEILLEWGHLMTVKEGFVITAYATSLLNERSIFYLYIFSQCDCVYPRIFDTTKIPLADIVQWKNVCI